MLNVRFYTVMGELCAEICAWDHPTDEVQGKAKRLARIYRRIDAGGVRMDDLWLAIQDLARDHCERGYHDDLSQMI